MALIVTHPMSDVAPPSVIDRRRARRMPTAVRFLALASGSLFLFATGAAIGRSQETQAPASRLTPHHGVVVAVDRPLIEVAPAAASAPLAPPVTVVRTQTPTSAAPGGVPRLPAAVSPSRALRVPASTAPGSPLARPALPAASSAPATHLTAPTATASPIVARLTGAVGAVLRPALAPVTTAAAGL